MLNNEQVPAFIVIAVAIFLIFFFVGLLKSTTTISSHWQHFYEDCEFSAIDFYKQVAAALKEQKITGLKIDETTFRQSHVFSGRRAYLKISHDEYVFYIGAAAFGTGTFVSWWLCIKDERLINWIPILNLLAGKDRKNKTFYQMDTEGMYRSAIHGTVMSVAEGLTDGHGERGLTEKEMQIGGGRI